MYIHTKGQHLVAISAYFRQHVFLSLSQSHNYNIGCVITLVEHMTVQDVQCARSWGEGANLEEQLGCMFPTSSSGHKYFSLLTCAHVIR